MNQSGVNNLNILWSRFKSNLEQPDLLYEARQALINIYDELNAEESNFICINMFEKIKKTLNSNAKFEQIDFSILSLASPYFTNSHLKYKLLGIIDRKFVNDRFIIRNSFLEQAAIAYSLLELSGRLPISPRIWIDFYNRFESNEEWKEKAFDVALAGLSKSGVEKFAELMRRRPLDEYMCKRWIIYLPVLLEIDGPRRVRDVLAQITVNARPHVIKSIISAAEVIGVNFQFVPEELKHSHERINMDLEYASEQKIIDNLLNDKTLTIVRSNYANLETVTDYQDNLIQKIKELAHPEKIECFVDETSDFSELPGTTSGRRKLIYAFPTYLTDAKKLEYGYACLKFGYQRRLGLAIPKGTNLSRDSSVNTLDQLLQYVATSTATVWCRANYAMSEIVLQAADKEQELRKRFFKNSPIRVFANPEHDSDTMDTDSEVYQSYSGPPRGQTAKQAAFLFDLSEKYWVMQQITDSNNEWLSGASYREISHNLDIPVGIGLNRYAAEWVRQPEIYVPLTELLGKWIRSDTFRYEMRGLGIEIGQNLEDETDNIVRLSSTPKGTQNVRKRGGRDYAFKK